MLSYLNCFNSIKLALLKKNRYTYININRKNTIIINLLIKYNVIYGYKIIFIKKREYYLVYVNTAVPYYNIKNLHKLSKPRVLRYKDLIKLPNKNTGSKYIFSTSNGFLEMKEMINKRKGGILLFKIN